MSVPTVPPAVKFMANESHIILSASFVVIVGTVLLSTVIVILPAAPPSRVAAVASQGTPFCVAKANLWN